MEYTRRCLECKGKFTTDNKQKFYCTEKCRMDNGNRQAKKRKEQAKKRDKQFFSFDDYKDGII